MFYVVVVVVVVLVVEGIYHELLLVFLINNRKIQHVGTYNLTNRVLGQIREKVTSVYLELTSLRSVNSENLGHFFPELTSNPVS